jgi:hypothetical protein
VSFFLLGLQIGIEILIWCPVMELLSNKEPATRTWKEAIKIHLLFIYVASLACIGFYMGIRGIATPTEYESYICMIIADPLYYLIYRI